MHKVYISALWDHWQALIGGVVSLIGSLAVYVAEKLGKHWLDPYPAIALLIVGVFCLYVAGYRAWRDEHDARSSELERFEDGKPILVLIARPESLRSIENGTFIFFIENVGKRAATFIHIDPIKSLSGKFELQLKMLQPEALQSGPHRFLIYEVYEPNNRSIHDGLMENEHEMLWHFFGDNPDGQPSYSYIVTIRYHDRDVPRADKAKLHCEGRSLTLTVMKG